MRKGEIFLCPDFNFHDGCTGNKYFVILNNPPQDKFFLLILTTTKPRLGWENRPGCYVPSGCFFISANTQWFPDPTWLKFNSVYSVPYQEAIDKERNNTFRLRGLLTTECCNSVVNCIKMSFDITNEQKALL